MFTAQHAVIFIHNAFDLLLELYQKLSIIFLRELWSWFVVISNFLCNLDEQEWYSNWCLLLWRNGVHTNIHQLKGHAVILPKIVKQENQKDFKLFIVLVKSQEFELIFQWLVRVYSSLWNSMR